jgi:hypothetical protein
MEPGGCNRWQSVANEATRENRRIKRKPLPPVATNCCVGPMVTRGVDLTRSQIAWLSKKARFRGPLVAQTSIRRLAQPHAEAT